MRSWNFCFLKHFTIVVGKPREAYRTLERVRGVWMVGLPCLHEVIRGIEVESKNEPPQEENTVVIDSKPDLSPKSIEKTFLIRRNSELERTIQELKEHRDFYRQLNIEYSTILAEKNKHIEELEANPQKVSNESDKKIINAQAATIGSLSERIDRLTKQKEGLEITLQQKVLRIKRDFNPEKLNNTRVMVYNLFLETNANEGQGFNREELAKAYLKKYGSERGTPDCGRRAYEMLEERFGAVLFHHDEPDGTVRLFLSPNPSQEQLYRITHPLPLPPKKTLSALVHSSSEDQGRGP